MIHPCPRGWWGLGLACCLCTGTPAKTVCPLCPCSLGSDDAPPSWSCPCSPPAGQPRKRQLDARGTADFLERMNAINKGNKLIMHIICPKKTDANAAQFAESNLIAMANSITTWQFLQHSWVYEWQGLKHSGMKLMQSYWPNKVLPITEARV